MELELDRLPKGLGGWNQTTKKKFNYPRIHCLKYIFMAKHNLIIVRAQQVSGTVYKSHLLCS